jgi:hypothetical protein
VHDDAAAPNEVRAAGSTPMVVTPPATARSMAGSCGQNECSARSPAVMGSVASLPSSCPSVSGTG